jgi:hypothetical protein
MITMAFDGETLAAVAGEFANGDTCKLRQLPGLYSQYKGHTIAVAAIGTPRIVAAMEEFWQYSEKINTCYPPFNLYRNVPPPDRPTYDAETESYAAILVTRGGAYSVLPHATRGKSGLTARVYMVPILEPVAISIPSCEITMLGPDTTAVSSLGTWVSSVTSGDSVALRSIKTRADIPFPGFPSA